MNGYDKSIDELKDCVQKNDILVVMIDGVTSKYTKRRLIGRTSSFARQTVNDLNPGSLHASLPSMHIELQLIQFVSALTDF